jgi:hypothetical protein
MLTTMLQQIEDTTQHGATSPGKLRLRGEKILVLQSLKPGLRLLPYFVEIFLKLSLTG